MDSNSSFVSSVHSAETDVLIKIPNNFFEPNLCEKSHFSNENEFITELDNFLCLERQKDVHNSTVDEACYTGFNDHLQSTNEDLNLQEEKLKRQHQEQLTSILQKKVLQYQQKTVFLSKLVSGKEQVIQSLRKNEGLDDENIRLKQKITTLEEEVNNTIHLIKNFQSKNDVLELKIENLTSTSSEMREISKRQVKDLEVRLSNCMLEKKEHSCEIEKLQEKYKIERENNIKEKHSRTLLDREVSTLRSQLKCEKEEKVRLQENHNKEKQTSETKQKKIFNNMMNEFAEKERKLIQEWNMQRTALKTYYQAQLESGLEEKVAEFQEQLENFQEEIKQEAKSRERNHTELAISQMEMIIKKNEEEIGLINQKCSEEVELYRIQLLNATKTIESLEMNLREYQIRRHNIAENLHSVMETQWKKTLEILTNPSTLKYKEELPSNDVSEIDNHQHENVMSNLSRSEENLKAEMVRYYIDMLLKQSPNSDEAKSTSYKIYKFSSKAPKPWK